MLMTIRDAMKNLLRLIGEDTRLLILIYIGLLCLYIGALTQDSQNDVSKKIGGLGYTILKTPEEELVKCHEHGKCTVFKRPDSIVMRWRGEKRDYYLMATCGDDGCTTTIPQDEEQ